MSILKQVDLFFCEGSSDKEYHLQLEKFDDRASARYIVNFQYGRRGSALNTGDKGTFDNLAAAEKVYNKVMGEKVGKGYHEGSGENATQYTAPQVHRPAPVEPESNEPVVATRRLSWDEPEPAQAERFVPQLLNYIDESELETHLRDDAWGAQEKKDGRHQMLRRAGGVVTAMNKKGKEIGFPKAWADEIAADCLIDGEAIGDTFHVFDILQGGSEDYRPYSYQTRHTRLTFTGNGPIKVVPLAVGYKAKKKLYDELVAGKKEGIVFKRLDSKYKPGKAHSDMVKLKFYEEASVIVVRHNQKNSIAVGLLNEAGEVVDMGNCTTIGHEKPPVGSICEIRYLYAYKGGCFYQPAFKEPRDDVDRSECTVKNQRIKFKAEED